MFDKAERITKGNARTQFDYGVGQARFRRVDETRSAGTWSARRTTTYFGSVEYIENHTTGESYYQRQIAGVALVRFYDRTEEIQTDFLLKDHLGSIHTVVQYNNALQRMHFGAFGERVDPVDWESTLGTAGFLNAITTRGFTGHEHVDDLGIIHMNGRIYDPRIGRFLQADPFVQAPKNGQNLNRYSYVLNNPLSYTDPSGYFFDKLWDAIKPFIGIIVAAVIIVATGGTGGWIAASWYNAAIVGAASGAASAAVNGGNILRGALFGAIAGAGFQQIGIAGFGPETESLARSAWSYGTDLARRSLSAGHDFATAGFASAFGGTVSFGGSNTTAQQMVAVGAATVGATGSAVTDGKFANGANSVSSDYLFATAHSSSVEESRGFTTSSGVEVSYGSNAATGEHRYRIRAMICSLATSGCNESYADRVFAYVNRNDIPFIENDLGTGPRELFPSLFSIIGLGEQPIRHFEFVGERISINETRPLHQFHPGTVRHAVFFDEYGLYYEVLGAGSGASPNFNNFAGIFLFRPGVEEVVNQFGR